MMKKQKGQFSATVELAQTVGLKGFLLHCGRFHLTPSVTKSSTIKLYLNMTVMSMGTIEFATSYFDENNSFAEFFLVIFFN